MYNNYWIDPKDVYVVFYQPNSYSWFILTGCYFFLSITNTAKQKTKQKKCIEKSG